MKRKIVHVAQSAGGVAEYLYMFLKNFQHEEYQNILIVSEDYKEQIKRFKPYVQEIHIIPMIREINIKSDIRAIFKLKKKLKSINPDIVYLHSSKAGALGRIALFSNLKAKIFYNAHGWYFNAQISNKKKKIFALIEKILALKTNKIINISKSEYESALQYKIAPKQKMCIIENGIDFNKFKNSTYYRDKTRGKYNISENDIVIGVVGRLTEQKDPMTSIKAFKLIKEKYKNTKFMFIGAGEQEIEVLEYSKENKFDKDVIITGWVKDVEKYIPALDIAILPSKWEGFGLAIIEYMACDKPIIASNIGGIANIIQDGENGYLIDSGNEEQLANKMEFLLKEKDIIKKIINNNRIYRKQFDVKNVVKYHIKIIEEFMID